MDKISSNESVFKEAPYVSYLHNLAREWIKKDESNSFTAADIRTHWKRNVPRIYALPEDCDCLNIAYNEELACEVLFHPLERFILGRPDEKDPSVALSVLKTQDQPLSLCGKVFRKSEPTYSCRDCGLDPTCVLCIECFKNSEHKSHRYKMSSSGGGGYCDCGDKEAWKQSPFCSNHQPRCNLNEPQKYNPTDDLPEKMINRIKIVFKTILSYCIEILTWENTVGLPGDLQIIELDGSNPPNTYVTVMYNDEIHTYDQVIQALTRAIECTSKDAMDYATIVDKEGRSTIKCAMFIVCEKIEKSIRRLTSRSSVKALKVNVMHTFIMAHQTFALKVLQWLNNILGYAEVFRRVFSEVILEPDVEEITEVRYCRSMLEKIMSKDTSLWKAARIQWHQLMISGMLMEQECKQTFSRVYTQNYSLIMKEFIADDHDHSLSVSAFSVQIFTVPTLAQMLIHEENAIALLLNTFNSECEHRKNAETGKLVFEKHDPIVGFRRAQYILYDLKYLLLSRPEEWNLVLRRNFLQGLSSLLTLMSWMQGMDFVVRQVGQHMEFEPEWETGFNLHIQLSIVIELMMLWCGLDRIVLIKAFRACLKCIQCLDKDTKFVTKELCGYAANCISYDIKSEAVSVHIPVSRFISGLFLHLPKYGLSYDSPDFDIDNKPTPAMLMEMPLRTLVMVAQVRAGMWRRNGYSLLNQIFFYQNVRCRSEMYDKDIIMLQTAACLLDPNQFIIHMLNKFNLINWSLPDWHSKPSTAEDGSFRFQIALVDELLYLMIVLISERHVGGIGKVTKAERVKKEIIQLLCIEPMAHSELCHNLPDDKYEETGLEDVIEEIADFNKPQESHKGKYTLKDDSYQDFNPFFYHYSKKEQSKAEERQRKLRKQRCEEECCPPPIPPEPTEYYLPLVHLLDSDIMIYLLRIILSRINSEHSQFTTENHFNKVLHLIGLALHEEVCSHEKESRENVVSSFNFCAKADEEGLLPLLESLNNNAIIEAHKDLLQWVIKKFVAVRNMRKICSKTEKSKVGEESVTMMESDNSDEEKLKRSKFAAERRAKIMAQMLSMQKKFINSHADLFAESDNSLDIDEEMDQDVVPEAIESSSALSLSSQLRFSPVDKVTCILCQETLEVSTSNQAMVLAAFVQKSTVLSQSRHKIITDPENHDPLLMSCDLFCSPHTKTCGHVMHSECYQKVFDSALARERRPPLRYRHNMSFDINKHEFLCPLCESITNTTIPLLPPLSSFVSESKSVSSQTSVISFDEWLSALCTTLQHKITITNDSEGSEQTVTYKSPKLSAIVKHLPVSVARNFEDLYTLYKVAPFPEISTNFKEMMLSYGQAVYTIGLGLNPQLEDSRTSLMMWQSCAYTIHSFEWLFREQKKPLFGSSARRQVDCLRAVVRFSFSYNLVIPLEVTHNHCIRLFSWLLGQEDSYNNDNKSIIEVDMFTLLVSLSSCACTLFLEPGLVPLPLGNIIDLFILRLVYVAHVVQILLTSTFDVSSSKDVDMDTSSKAINEEQNALHWYKIVRKSADFNLDGNFPPGHKILKVIKQSTLPFLRCAAIYYNYMTDVPTLPEMKELFEPENEHETLCCYLGLSSDLSQLTQSVQLHNLIERWLCHDTVKNIFVGASSSSIIQYPLKVTQLVDLPLDYSDLINEVSLFTCPNSDGDDSRTPAMCLVCGEILCSQSYCCQTELDNEMVGACCNHSHKCGVGNSMFLRIRDCKLLLRSGLLKGCFVSPPYLDQYGETDSGLKRGNPLHLSHEKYKELHCMWLSHNIPEVVSRTLEASSNVMGIEWQNL